MKTIRLVLWLAILVGWVIASTIHPESDNAARTVVFICGAIIEIVYRIRKKDADDTPITPDPIQSLNLTKRQ
jgi:hypothetical protein